ncbi:muscle LIM protein Mlp84B-like [Penaeus japonicus]|uniref:muscle LIM protein Mlp84B-like n=1 Tax=Penaeus japonicus TaxID=27405 RepID=UPI001C70DE2A|nr:muscle LIM protein Mlp84B-like [Penaeus japonicus]
MKSSSKRGAQRPRIPRSSMAWLPGCSTSASGFVFYRKRNELAPYTPPKAKPGEGCPRCGGKVFAAEEMLAKGKSYHRTCFNCKNCRKPLDSVVHCDGPDKDVYCKG